MTNRSVIKKKIEYGDFQTPYDLAFQVCNVLKSWGIKPNSILEPTCGTGNFLTCLLYTSDAADE